MAIKVKWTVVTPKGNRERSQACASGDVARTVVTTLQRDTNVTRAMAFYTDDRGAFAGFERDINGIAVGSYGRN